MKNYCLALSLITLLMTGCSLPSQFEVETYIQNEFGGHAEVRNLENVDNIYIVRDTNNAVWIVKVSESAVVDGSMSIHILSKEKIIN